MAKALLVSGVGGAFLLCLGLLPGEIVVGMWAIAALQALGVSFLVSSPIVLVASIAIPIWFVIQQVGALYRAADGQARRRAESGRSIAPAIAVKLATNCYAAMSPLLAFPALRLAWGMSFGEAFFLA